MLGFLQKRCARGRPISSGKALQAEADGEQEAEKHEERAQFQDRVRDGVAVANIMGREQLHQQQEERFFAK